MRLNIKNNLNVLYDYVIHRRYFSVVVSLILITFVFVKIDAVQIGHIILEVNLVYYLTGQLLILLFLALKAKRWQLLLHSQNIICSTFRSFTIYNIGSLYGLLTPGRIGDFIKVYYLSRDGTSKIDALWGILYDRILDVVMLIILNILAFFVLGNLLSIFREVSLIFLGILVFGGVLSFLLFLWAKSKSDLLIKYRSSSDIYHAVYSWGAKFKKGMVIPILKIWQIPFTEQLLIFVFTILVWVVLFCAYYAFSKSLGIDIALGMFVSIISISMFASNLPISFSGIGVRDLSLIFLLSLVGINESSAVGLSLLVLSTYLLSALIGALLLLFENTKREHLPDKNSGQITRLLK